MDVKYLSPLLLAYEDRMKEKEALSAALEVCWQMLRHRLNQIRPFRLQKVNVPAVLSKEGGARWVAGRGRGKGNVGGRHVCLAEREACRGAVALGSCGLGRGSSLRREILGCRGRAGSGTSFLTTAVDARADAWATGDYTQAFRERPYPGF